MTTITLYCTVVHMSKKKPKIPQAAKVPNEGWMRARIDQSNRNNTRPSGAVYKRPKAGAKGRDW